LAIDIDHLNHSVFGDAGLRAEVLGLFVEQTTRILAAFDPALDDAAWRHLAHTLKGSARGVGAFALGDVLAQAEELYGDMDDKSAARAALLVRIAAEALAAIKQAETLAAAA
jgi:HPt (histidine-containing phosphotransfer) domain-containing protein